MEHRIAKRASVSMVDTGTFEMDELQESIGDARLLPGSRSRRGAAL
jgi:hypothetical protein